MNPTRPATSLLVVMASLAAPATVLARANLPERVLDPDPILEVGVVEGADVELFVSVLDASTSPPTRGRVC
jgi:hypothetical protein